MLKCTKTKRVDEKEGSENKSKLLEPSTSKAEKEVTDKKIRLYKDGHLSMGFTWTAEENCLLPLCTLCGEKLSNWARAPQSYVSISELTTATYQIKN
jgi:hypothetical protein